ncbi:MAG TPA: HEAT repeat domain-containing protein [Pyrinomonadaceae bacterium]|nr:HEAT repeat domain-containing protein [Pyrinomonadaceae bacterium]
MLNKNNRPTSSRQGRNSLIVVALVLTLILTNLFAAAVLDRGAAQEVDKLNRFVQSQNAAAAQVFREGRDFIGDEEWAEAEGKFRSFISSYPKDGNLDAALYWLAFALSKQEKFKEAEKQLKRLLKEFPRSNWADDATALRVQIAQNVGNPEIINQTLNEDDIEIKIVALQSLFESNPERGLAYVAEMMKPTSTANVRLKEAGIEMLRRFGGKQSVPMLLDIIRNQTDQKLRVTAINTLGRSGDESVLPLLKELATTSTDDEISQAAIFAISRFSGAGAQAMLVDLARTGKSIEVRKNAIFWLSNSGESVLDELLRIYDADRTPEVRKQIIFALKRIGTPRAFNKLYEIARSGDDMEVRKDAFHWIGQGGGAQALDFLIQTYDAERDVEIKQQIIFALSRTGDKRAVQKMMDIARRDPSVELRKQAIFWLGKSNDPEAQKFIEGLLN